MKKFMMFVAAMVIATASANASVNEFSGDDGETILKETESFSEVNVGVPARIRLVSGDKYSVSVTADNVFVAEAINSKVKDDVLYISTRDIEALEASTDMLIITIECPGLPILTTSRDMESSMVRE